MRALVFLLMLAACAYDPTPSGYKDYCDRHPDRPECGGKK